MGWLFVYGTLMPGRLRWPHVAAEVADQRPATITGTLYDTGRGYPALVLGNGDGAGTVRGWLLGFAAEQAAVVLERLDEVEGPDYRRAPVTTADGTAAVAYEYLGSPTGLVPLPAGVWDREDER